MSVSQEPRLDVGHKDHRDTQALASAAKVLQRDIRNNHAAVLCNPRVSFALVDLLLSLATAAEIGLLNHVAQSAAVRTARSINDLEQENQGSIKLARCGCSSRHLRISLAMLSQGPITCGVCNQPFTLTLVRRSGTR